jgi:hypothetical protein
LQGGALSVFDTDSREDLVQKFVNLGDDRHIVKVWVQGRLVKPCEECDNT